MRPDRVWFSGFFVLNGVSISLLFVLNGVSLHELIRISIYVNKPSECIVDHCMQGVFLYANLFKLSHNPNFYTFLLSVDLGIDTKLNSRLITLNKCLRRDVCLKQGRKFRDSCLKQVKCPPPPPCWATCSFKKFTPSQWYFHSSIRAYLPPSYSVFLQLMGKPRRWECTPL